MSEMATKARYTMADSDIDWAIQNELRREWLDNNPDSEYPGWLSI